MQNDLIACIKYFLQMEDIDSTEAIGFVIDALEKSGLSFQEAIETISFNIGFLAYPVLGSLNLFIKKTSPHVKHSTFFCSRHLAGLDNQEVRHT